MGPPPCDPTQVLFSLFCMGLHTLVETCKGAKDFGGDKGILGGGWGGLLGLCCGTPSNVTPLRFSFQCSVWACMRVCKRARVQRIVGGDKGMWGEVGGGVVGLGCGTPPCDPTQVLFALSCMALHTRVQTCKGRRDWGVGLWGGGGDWG